MLALLNHDETITDLLLDLQLKDWLTGEPWDGWKAHLEELDALTAKLFAVELEE